MAFRGVRSIGGTAILLGAIVTMAWKPGPVQRGILQQTPDGAKIFANTCAACHQPSGLGMEGKYPPLAESEWVSGSEGRMIRIVLQGLTGDVEVQGESHTGLMPGLGATYNDAELAAVMTYVRTRFGGKAPAITPTSVTKIRAATADRKIPWTAPELLKLP